MRLSDVSNHWVIGTCQNHSASLHETSWDRARILCIPRWCPFNSPVRSRNGKKTHPSKGNLNYHAGNTQGSPIISGCMRRSAQSGSLCFSRRCRHGGSRLSHYLCKVVWMVGPEKSAVVTFELDLKDDGDQGLHSGEVRPFHPPVEVDTEPGDGYLCPSCPWPWWALHYPSGRVFHRKGRTLFDPPHGQPKFNDRSLRGFMDQILYRGHKPLRTGFFYNEETGAVFGEESAMEHLAQQLHLMDEPQERAIEGLEGHITGQKWVLLSWVQSGKLASA